MKATSDDFKPRRDGWYEHKGVWDEVTVGTVLASQKRTERWEVIATAMAVPVQYGRTLWFRVREQTTGEIHAIEPKVKTAPCTILTQDPRDTRTPPRQPPENLEAVELVIRELGATLLASRDHTTGDIVCPDYCVDPGHIEGYAGRTRGLIEHMRFAHQMSVDDGMKHEEVVTLHGHAHGPRWPNIGKGGFPHRHVPEDLSIL